MDILTSIGTILEIFDIEGMIDNDIYSFGIKTDKCSFKIITESECCSSSWFEVEQGLNFLIGKSIVNFEEGETFDSPTNYDNEDTTTELIFHLSDGSIFNLNFRHTSNGYYSGYYKLTEFKSLIPIQLNSKIKIFIVLGLPGSGKSTYLKKFNDCYIMDDILSDWLNQFKIRDNINSSKNIVVADPRLCSMKTFKILLDFFINNVVSSESQIYFRYFENNSKQCLINIESRDKLLIKYFTNNINELTIPYDEVINEISHKPNSLSMSVYEKENNSAIIIQSNFRRYLGGLNNLIPGGRLYLAAEKRFYENAKMKNK